MGQMRNNSSPPHARPGRATGAAERPVGAGWALVVPAKSLDRAKSRMTSDVADPARRSLVRAMLGDVVDAARACPRVAALAVVTSDAALAEVARAGGAEIVDEFGPGAAVSDAAGARAGHGAGAGAGADDTAGALVVAGGDAPFRRAAALGLHRAGAAHRGPLAVLASDLPGLDPAELEAALRAAEDVAPSAPRGFVADAEGTGTTLATFTDHGDLRTFFGPGSAAAFAASGARDLGTGGDWPGLRRDVDALVHLTVLDRLGPRTAAAHAAGHPRDPASGPDERPNRRLGRLER